ncbi:MAG TPA: class I SAM-dependent methyltransferase [Candidatus Eisenbacteria bacterium]|nr:class I SAM-dependent methyltransferase [Candidatus Eisenbacteria bacterium]
MDALTKFKEMQRQGWAHFAPLETWTTPPAAKLVRHARVAPGTCVLDVGCGTGVVAITAARRGARATGLDLTPELLERARENARLARVEIDWHQGDAEELPFEDRTFDMVLSQFGHMFAPRPEVAVAEMLRVLKPGGTIAFSTWPPELGMGRLFGMITRYLPPPPIEIPPPALWGDPNVVRERLGGAVKNVAFERGTMEVGALSPQHYREVTERTAGPVIKLVESLSANDPKKLEVFRREFEALVEELLEDNLLRQGFLMTRAVKA